MAQQKKSSLNSSSNDSDTSNYSSSSANEHVQNSRLASQNPPHISNPTPVASAGSESDSDSEPKTTNPSPISNSIPVASAESGGSDSELETTKSLVSKSIGGVTVNGENCKKTLRIFKEQDRLTMLEGLDDHILKTRNDPRKNKNHFHSFIKTKPLHRDFTADQIKQKLRGFNSKFGTAWRRRFTTTHDKKVFELCMKIRWEKINASEFEELRKLQIAELQLFVDRAQLIKDQANMILQELNKSFVC